MQRRQFIQKAAIGTGFACLHASNLSCSRASNLFGGVNSEKYPELKKHKITKVERLKYDYHWPRHVGKNARKDNHGQYKTDDIFKLGTDQGAMGWALGRSRLSDEELFQLEGKLVSELISPEKGMRQDLSPYVDFVLHDLMGVILNKPVYKLFGAKGTKNTPIYSGMFCFDELEPKDNPAGLDKILENVNYTELA